MVMTISNPGVALRYIELEGLAVKTVAIADAWEDWDLSALVPVGTFAVEIMGHCSTNGQSIGARENGSAQDRIHYAWDGGAVLTFMVATVKVPASRIIEVRNFTLTDQFKLMGYWI